LTLAVGDGLYRSGRQQTCPASATGAPSGG